MPKEYKQKLRQVWMDETKFKTCIKKDFTDPTKAFSTYCKTTINAKLWDFKKQVETKKLLANTSSIKSN